MTLVYSDILPMKLFGDQKTFIEYFNDRLKETDRLEIAVGYISLASLLELERISDEQKLQSATLIIGMYFIEGFPEKIYHETLRIARKWKENQTGEIRLIIPFKYHGKAYGFYAKEKELPFSGIVGSANLSALKPDYMTRRQYELSVLIEDDLTLKDLNLHFEQLKQDKISKNILDVDNIPLIQAENTAIIGNELVDKLPVSDLEYFNTPAVTSFRLKLKVPKYEDRMLDDGKHYTKSNINVCYAAPRNKNKSRDWYEMQLTVGASVYKMEGYPEKNVPFYILTDDGYWFKAHTTSDNNKQFAAVGDELIMGRWLKGRLAAAGLVSPVNDTGKDIQRDGMITQEILEAYGRDELLFEKTQRKARDADGKELDVWKLSFEKSDESREE